MDTTVLVYAVGVEHRFRAPCRRLLAAVADEAVEATTTVEVIQEFVHIRARRRGRPDAAALGRHYAALLAPLLPVGAEELASGLTVFENVEGVGAFDAILAGAALTAGAHALVSADHAFTDVSGLLHVVPDAAGVAALLDEP